MATVEPRGATPVRTRDDVRTARRLSVSLKASRPKRLSLFSRSTANSSELESSTLQAMKSPRGADRDSLTSPTLRPNSLQSRRPAHFGSIRDSLLGGRKHSSMSRPSSRSSETSPKSHRNASVDPAKLHSDLVPFVQPSQQPSQSPKQGQAFKSAREYYHHRKKSSISPPFNFQHVTHTAKNHVAKLETVDERELKHKFWALHAYQKPKEELRGIKVEDREKHHERSLSPGARAALPARPRRIKDASPTIMQQTITRSLDETLFDETQETKFNPDDAYQSLGDVEDGPGHVPSQPSPKHCASMSVLSTPPIEQRLRSYSSFDNGSARASSSQRLRASSLATSTPSTDKPSQLQRQRIAGQSFRERLPLPAIPRQADKMPDAQPKISSDSTPSLSPPASVISCSLFLSPPGTKMKLPASASSSRQSLSSARASHASKSPASHKTDVVSETSWEDDVDFAYEQAAEAVCDFDWEHTSRVQEYSQDGDVSHSNGGTPDDADSNGGVRLSSVWAGPPPALISGPLSNGTNRSSGYSSSVQSTDHKRGSSVGHRGFLAARSASENNVSKSSPAMSMDMSATMSKTPPPKFGFTDSDSETGNYPSPYNSSTLHFPTFDSSIPEQLSDPESPWTGRSLHRKSSSYGSYESSGRSLPATSDAARWSLASTSSMPDLVHGKRNRRSSAARSRLLRPLASVPGSPEPESEKPQDEDSLTVSSRDSILMRRPATPGDRQVLYSAGRTVQRGRSSTPQRGLLVPKASTPDEQQAQDEAGWI